MSDLTDQAMARLAAARTLAMSAIESIDEALSHMVDPSDDQKGDARAELVEEALEALGGASRALEQAQIPLEDTDFDPKEEEGDDYEDLEEDDQPEEPEPEPPEPKDRRKRRR